MTTTSQFHPLAKSLPPMECDDFAAPIAEIEAGGHCAKPAPNVHGMAVAPEGRDMAINFLRRAQPGGPWVITAIEPDGCTETKTFCDDEEAELGEFIERREGARNLYFTVNAARGSPTKKPAKADIERALFLHVDIDAPRVNGEASDVALHRIEEAKQCGLTALRTLNQKPTFIVDSGNGIHAYWRLDPPVGLHTDEDRDAVESRNRALARAVGGDLTVFNVDRLLRLPGTTNLPGARKRAYGLEPTSTKLIESNDTAYKLADFPPDGTAHCSGNGSDNPFRLERFARGNDLGPAQCHAPPIADIDDLIRFGAPIGTRSEEFNRVVWKMAALGHEEDEILSELKRYPEGISSKYADRLDVEVRRSFQKWKAQNPALQQERPVIRVVPGQIARAVDQTQTALLEAKLPIFERGRRLVEPHEVSRSARQGRQVNITRFEALSLNTLRYHLNKSVAVFEHWDGRSKKWVEIDPPKTVLDDLIAHNGRGFPSIRGIVSCPTLRPDGTVLCEPGYDKVTQLWCNSEVRLPEIRRDPNRADAEAALKSLRDLLSGFEFSTPLDEAVALSAIMTTVLRAGFDPAPLHLVRAHAPGSGKSLLVDVMAAIATGRACPVITPGKTTEEMEKRLGAILLEGCSLVSLDNLTGDLDGEMLCQLLTQTLIKPRILGKSEAPECEWTGTLLATGNNVNPIGDLVRRTLTCYLDPNVERPELRRFEFDPFERVLADRGTYIGAVLTIALGYREAGAPKPDNFTPLANYGGWAEAGRWPVVWLGLEDPVNSIERARERDPERAKAAELINLWKEYIGIGKSVTAREIILKAGDHAALYNFLN